MGPAPGSAAAPVPAPHGQQQRAEAVLVAGVHVRPSLQQHADRAGVAPPGCHVQRSLTAEVLQAQVTALERRRDVSPAEEGPGSVREPTGRGRKDRGTP